MTIILFTKHQQIDRQLKLKRMLEQSMVKPQPLLFVTSLHLSLLSLFTNYLFRLCTY